MLSMLIRKESFFKSVYLHSVLSSVDSQETKISKSSRDRLNLEDLINGTLKLNNERQYGQGVDILRAVIASLDYSLDTEDLDNQLIQIR